LDDLTLLCSMVLPSEEARARADEIISAFDKREKRRASRGFRKAERENEMAYEAYAQIHEAIAATPAATLQGMLAKVRCVRVDGCDEAIALSIFEDIERLAKTA
jgi:hypothetical protein